MPDERGFLKRPLRALALAAASLVSLGARNATRSPLCRDLTPTSAGWGYEPGHPRTLGRPKARARLNPDHVGWSGQAGSPSSPPLYPGSDRVEPPGRLAVLLFDPVREGQPRIPSRPIHGDGRLRECGIGERADRNRDPVGPVLGRPKDRRPTLWAETKRPLLAVVRDADVLRIRAGDIDSILRPPRLHPERAAGPTLTGKAMTHRDPYRITLCPHPQLATTAHRFALLHAPILRSRGRATSPPV